MPFFHMQVLLCQAFRFPTGLTPKQRAALHECAGVHRIPHTSTGEAEARQLVLGNANYPLQVEMQPAF